MKFSTGFYFFVFMLFLICLPYSARSSTIDNCIMKDTLNEDMLLNLSKLVIPDMDGKHKGEAGKIAIIGGSTAYTGAPYFSGITSLKVGADLVYIITTADAAPVIKSYSPDLIVIPSPSTSDLSNLLKTMHLVVIGPGLGKEASAMDMVYKVINMCKTMKKPLVIDADGLYAINKNITILKDYPSPGVILTPNHIEAKRLKEAISTISSTSAWYNFWGEYVTVLEKGEIDKYHSAVTQFNWNVTSGGSSRRAGGQGDILTGALATFYNWALKYKICENESSSFISLSQSIASYAAAILTRACNLKAYTKCGRSMLASDMLQEIHSVFDNIFI